MIGVRLACEVACAGDEAATSTGAAVLVVVGAGPRGVGFLERLSASVGELLPDRRIDVHFVDPFPPGPGRVWRHAQSPLLRMNSMGEDVTMFTDDSVRCTGPIVPGPSMSEWAELARSLADGHIDDELAELTGRTFATRRMASRYLSWFFDHVRENLPPTIRVVVHTGTVTQVTGGADGPQQVWLADVPQPLTADAVVFAMGHMDARNAGPVRELADFADRHGLYYLPPAYTADVDLSAIPAGEPVLVRGLGLAFVDLMVLLTEGRGGTFRDEGDGRLTYLASGAEPVLYAGSRRGVPYHSKIGYQFPGAPPPLPRFFGRPGVDALLERHPVLDFDAHVWPLIGKDTGWGYYHELCASHPERFAMPWAEFADRYTELDWDTEELTELVAAAVPDPADRFDVPALDRPLRGLSFSDADMLQTYVRDHIAADLARRADPAHSADLGAFLALLYSYGQVPAIVASGRLSPWSRRERLEGWWTGFFNFYASGPPADRLERLLALSHAGLVRFLGADMWVKSDEAAGVFVAGSASVPNTVTARALVDARLPKATVEHTANGLLRDLREHHAGVEELLTDHRGTGLLKASAEDGRLVDPVLGPHRRRFALGPFTNVRTAAAFARPRTNAPAFRYNDAAARAVLLLLGELTGESADARCTLLARTDGE